MNRRRVRLSVILLLATLASVPVMAEVFVVTLTNGSSLETARQPEQASWDSGTVLILSEVGNWVGISRSQIKDIEQRDQVRGFGRRVDNTTVALGEAPNDLPGVTPQTDPSARLASAMERFVDQSEADSNYSIRQGVSSEDTQGIPLRAIGFGSFPSAPIETPINVGPVRSDNPNQ
jgi:hypothetical protein